MDPLDDLSTLRHHAVGQKVFGRYLLKSLVGKGRTGDVWQAEDTRLRMPVALKMLANYPDHQLISDQIGQLLALTHPNIVRVYDFIYEDNAGALVTEFVQGTSAAQLLRQNSHGFFEPFEIDSWLRDLLSALQFAWDQGHLAHGDIRLANLLITRTGTLKVNEFGFALTRVGKSITESSQDGKGLSLPTMSPQVLAGEPALHCDDLYAVSACAYELLTGSPVFHSGNIIAQIQSKVPPKVQERRVEMGLKGGAISKAWESWVAQGLAKDRSERPAKAEDVMASLLAHATTPNTSRTTSALPQITKAVSEALTPKISWVSWVRHPLGLLAATLVALSFFVWWLIIGPNNAILAERETLLEEQRKLDSKTSFNPDDAIPETEPEIKAAAAMAATRTKAWAGLVDEFEFNELDFTSKDEQQVKAAKKKVALWKDAQEALQLAVGKITALKQEKADSLRSAIEKLENSQPDLPDLSPEDLQSLVTAWNDLIKKFDTPGKPDLQEFEDLVGNAIDNKTALEERLRIESEKLLSQQERVTAWEKRISNLVEEVKVEAANENLPAAEKVKAWEKVIVALDKEKDSDIPADKVESVRLNAVVEKSAWLERTKAETPLSPLSIADLFLNSPYATWTEPQQGGVLRMAQEKLKEAGLYAATPDGKSGPSTHKAIIDFQNQNKLIASAELNLRTLEQLGIAGLTEEQVAMAERVDAVKKPATRSTTASTYIPKPPPKGIYYEKGGSALYHSHRLFNRVDKKEEAKRNAYIRWETQYGAAWAAKHGR